MVLSLCKKILLSKNINHCIADVYKLNCLAQTNQAIPTGTIDDIEYTLPDNIKLTSMKEMDIFYLSENIPLNTRIIHQIAHIEFNAMKCYVDTVYRFCQQEDQQFIKDFIGIAYEESLHFQMLNHVLLKSGYEYGSFPLCGNLRDRINDTKHSLLERLAYVSLCQEGRGMDTGQNLVEKVKPYSQEDSQVLQQIVNEEQKHVEVGLRWFNQKSGNPQQEFLHIMNKFNIKCNWKINYQKRTKAGFSKEWIDTLKMWRNQ